MSNSALLSCMDTLRESSALAAALARGAVDLSDAIAGGVFLFDYSGTLLRLAGLWDDHDNPIPVQDVECSFSYENHPEDLLCFAIRKGEPHGAALIAEQAMPSVMSVQHFLTAVCAYWIAVPLRGFGTGILGGVLLGFAKITILPEDALIFIRYGGVELALRYEHDLRLSLETRLGNFEQTVKDLQNQPVAHASLGIIAHSAAMQSVLALSRKAAASTASVLITGETGTGKTLIASCIHCLSDRKDKAFVVVDCASIPESLLESELFGHTKGAFTGADKAAPGLLGNADGGTVLFDEIGEMPPALQGKLLRFLQERKVRPIGGTKEISVNVKIIAATNQDLLVAVETGAFRRDLYHRLAVFPIAVPALRDRREDVLPLAEHFMRCYAMRYQRRPGLLQANDSRRLQCHTFSGNVRELAALVERSFILWPQGEEFRLSWEIPLSSYKASLTDTVKAYERNLIQAALEKCEGNTRNAASILGLPRRTLAYKLRVLGLSEDKPTLSTAEPCVAHSPEMT
jgi:sigma-54-dependent transcriptional regulator